MDYSIYKLSSKEIFIIIAQSMLISALLAVICYRSIWGMIIAVVIMPVWFKVRKAEFKRKRLKLLESQFREAMQSVSGALYAGYSLENAWRSAGGDLVVIYGEDALMVKEIEQMLYKLSVGKNFRQILQDFGDRCNLKDVQSFCRTMEFAIKSGGDMTQIIQTTVKKINDRYEVQRELDTVTAEKQLEFNIMMIIPIGIIVFITFASPGYLDPLYNTAQGKFIMTACIGVYAIAVFIAKRLVRIE